MLMKNKPLDEIVEFTELSLAEIHSIQQELNLK
jgi:hypothetical protein